jgi:MFS family permease
LDVITFFVALAALSLVRIPQPPRTTDGLTSRGNLWQESFYGLKYILARRGLLGMEMVFFFGNLFGGMALTVVTPMILARTGGDSLTLGSVLSASAIAGVAGALIMSAWGGPKRRVHGILLGTFISCFFGLALVGVGHAPMIWIIGSVIFAGLSPIVNGCETAILQAKVAPDVQGRVFAAVNFISWFTNPISPLIAGLLADQLLEPWMASQSSFAQILGSVFGNHPGAGMGVLITLCGLSAALVGLAGYLFPALRNLEDELPDYDCLVTLKKATRIT